MLFLLYFHTTIKFKYVFNVFKYDGIKVRRKKMHKHTLQYVSAIQPALRDHLNKTYLNNRDLRKYIYFFVALAARAQTFWSIFYII